MAPRYKSSLRALGCVYTDSSSMIKNPDIFPREYYENSLEFHVSRSRNGEGERWNFILERGCFRLFSGALNGRALYPPRAALPSTRSPRTIMKQPVTGRLVLPLPRQIPEICASALTLSSRRSRSTTSLDPPPRISSPAMVPSIGSLFYASSSSSS